MKQLFVAALVILVFDVAFGSSSTSLMLIKKNSGFVPAEQSYSIVCEIHSDVVLRRWKKGGDSHEAFDSAPTQFSRAVSDAKRARALLKESTKGQLRTSLGPTDGPTASYVGLLEDEVVSIRIKILEIAGTEIHKNTARATSALVAFANANCTR